MYGVAGERRLPEFELDWLPGYEASRPGARRQRRRASRCSSTSTARSWTRCTRRARPAWRPTRGRGACRSSCSSASNARGSSPTRALWEVRGPRRHFTHSKVLAWVAFDRAVKRSSSSALTGRWSAGARIRDAIHDDVCRARLQQAARARSRSRTAASALDASLLLMPLVGFLPATDPRVTGTVAAIERELLRDGFVLRY